MCTFWRTLVVRSAQSAQLIQQIDVVLFTPNSPRNPITYVYYSTDEAVTYFLSVPRKDHRELIGTISTLAPASRFPGSVPADQIERR